MHEVYAVDVLISTGEGKVRGNLVLILLVFDFYVAFLGGMLRKINCFLFQAKDGGQRTTVYKRDPNKVYGLKMKTSRTFFSEMERRFDTMPFTLRYHLFNLPSNIALFIFNQLGMLHLHKCSFKKLLEVVYVHSLGLKD